MNKIKVKEARLNPNPEANLYMPWTDEDEELGCVNCDCMLAEHWWVPSLEGYSRTERYSGNDPMCSCNNCKEYGVRKIEFGDVLKKARKV